MAGNDSAGNDEVYLGSIHRAKGKEFQNVVYFNLAKTAAHSEKIHEEEERRVAYVGATRPKDSLLITFPAEKPSLFLPEICLNPKFKGVTDEDLARKTASTRLRLKKEETKLKQIELYRGNQFARFEALTESHTTDKPAFLLQVTWMIANWRMQKTQAKIESLNKQIKKHTETILEPLRVELSDFEEEIRFREAIEPVALEESVQKQGQ